MSSLVRVEQGARFFRFQFYFYDPPSVDGRTRLAFPSVPVDHLDCRRQPAFLALALVGGKHALPRTASHEAALSIARRAGLAGGFQVTQMGQYLGVGLRDH